LFFVENYSFYLGNKISSDGCVLLAQGMNSNESITMLNVMNQGPFGEACMDAWLDTFNVNISLIDLKWRVSSRKSFALNAAITRNRSIQRLRSSGKDWTSLLPDSLKKNTTPPEKIQDEQPPPEQDDTVSSPPEKEEDNTNE